MERLDGNTGARGLRVLLAAAGSHGDVLPMVALGRELMGRGHEVLVFANPVFATYAQQAGLPFVPISSAEAYAALLGELVEDDPDRAFRRVAEECAALGRDYYAAMRAHVVPGKTVAVGGSLLFAQRLLKETGGTPSVTVHLAPSVVRSNAQPARLMPKWIKASTPTWFKRLAWWAADQRYDAWVTQPLNVQRRELGLPPLSRIFQSWIHEADCVLGLFPEWFAQPQRDWPGRLQLVGFPLYDHGQAGALPAELAAFLQAGPAPVGISAGTATARSTKFFETSIAACQAAGLRGVLLLPFAAHIPQPLPEGFFHASYAPYRALLPRLAAFIHHGGIGSTSQALLAGVPQLIRPVAYDQFDNSARAAKLGVARELLVKDYRVARVADALRALVGDTDVRERCRQVSRRFDGEDAIAAAAAAIEASYERKTK